MADRISDVHILPCSDSKYIKPFTINYTQNGEQKKWDYTKVHDSVIIMIFNVTRKVFVMVKQFRPAVYVSKVEIANDKVDTDKYPGSIGMTYELCAGIVDKQCSLQELAAAEVLDETGYAVPADKIEKVSSYRAGVGTSGSRQTLFYTEVTDDMRVSEGGGLKEEGELIDVVDIPLKDSRQFLNDESKDKPGALLYAFMWFYENKAKQFQ
ncbi:uridine diphosphate glucose pyrophosphatase NUDT14-like [Glandiceps talaboti]